MSMSGPASWDWDILLAFNDSSRIHVMQHRWKAGIAVTHIHLGSQEGALEDASHSSVNNIYRGQLSLRVCAQDPDACERVVRRCGKRRTAVKRTEKMQKEGYGR